MSSLRSTLMLLALFQLALISSAWAQMGEEGSNPEDSPFAQVDDMDDSNPESAGPTPSVQPSASNEEGSEVTNFGYLNFTIVPGFKRIRLDRESTIGFSESILVTAGPHWVEITGPKGYADSSFRITVKPGDNIKKVIRLRNIVSGEIASMAIPTDEKPRESRKLGWKGYTQITTFVIGALTSFVAYQQEQKAIKARERYDMAGAFTESEFETIAAELDEAIKGRNGMIALSALSFSVGLVMFAF